MKKTTLKSLRPRSRLWVERDGVPVYGDGKHEWLELIEETGSLRATAETLGMSYRNLWGRLKEMERRLGVRLVVRHKGGPGGGGMELTADGRALVENFRQYRDRVDHDLARRFETFLASLGRGGGAKRVPRA
jgi:molybdate transport system regulatory protein